MPGPVVRVFVALFALVLGLAQASNAQTVPAPVCYAGFVGDLRRAIDDADEANDFFATVGTYSARATEGSADLLKLVGGDTFWAAINRMESLRSAGRNPFASDAATFEVIRSLAERQTGGLETTLRRIASENEDDFLNGQGALFDLYVVRRAADDGTNYARIGALEVAVPVPGGGTRLYDFVDDAGVRHENKYWTQGLPVSTSPAFQRFVIQFRQDMLANRGRLEGLRYNFPASSLDATAMAALKSRLDTELLPGSPLGSVLDEGQLTALADELSRQWRAGGLWALR